MGVREWLEVRSERQADFMKTHVMKKHDGALDTGSTKTKARNIFKDTYLKRNFVLELPFITPSLLFAHVTEHLFCASICARHMGCMYIES